MKKSTRVKVLFTVGLGAIPIVLNCFINLFITPKITNELGISAYGYVTLAKNFVSYAAILTVALNSYAARYLSVSYLRNEFDTFKKYFSTVVIGDTILASILLAFGVVTTLFLDHIIKIDYDLVGDVKILFIFCFSAFFITTVSTAYSASGHIKDRIDIINIIKAISYLCEIIILIVCFWCLIPKIWQVGVASLFASLVILIGTYTFTRISIQEAKVDRKQFSFDALKTLVINGFWNSANNLGNALNTGLDLLITNLMLNSVSMGQVSLAKTINNIIFSLYAAISQAFQPKMLQRYSQKDYKGLVRELKNSMKVSGIITNCIFAGFCAIGIEFINLWVPGQDTSTIHCLTILAMSPCLTEGCIYPLYYVYTLEVKNKIPCIITIIGGLVNVIGMYVLLKFTNIGVYAIVITTAVVMNFIGLVTNPLYICKCLCVKKSTFYPDIILNIILAGITTLILIGCKNVFNIEMNSWYRLICVGILLAVIAFAIQISITFMYRVIARKTFDKELYK